MDYTTGVTHNERERPKRASFIKMRLLIAIMATLCPVVCYIGRQNLPLAIVSMVQEGEEELGSKSPKEVDTVLNPTPLPDSVLGDDLGLLNSLTDANTSYRLMNVGPGGLGGGGASPSPASSGNFQATPSSPLSLAQTNAVSELKGVCPQPSTVDEFGKATTVAKARTYGPKYAWSQEDKGILLGVFFITYVIFQIPGARLAERVGAKWIMAAASSGTAILSLLSPWAASQHVHLLSLVQLLMGFCQATIYPSCYVLYSRWLPPAERSQALPILGVGAFIGSIVATSLTGYFSEQPALGWEWAFYAPGILCALWSLVWIWFASSEPHTHRYISIEEIQHIESKMDSGTKLGGGGGDETSSSAATKKDISWRRVFTSRSIWIMMVAFFASNWAFAIVMRLLPTYLNSILQVSSMENGMVNSVIYILFCIVSPLVGTVSTMMVETRACGLSRLAIRKLFQCTALFGLATCFLAITWLGCDRRLVFAVLFTQIVFFSLVNGGEVQLPVELSPDFSGTIYAIGNCIGSSTGFLVPPVYSLIVTDPQNRALWDYYFYLAAVITSLGGLIFLLFGQNKMQDFGKDLGESQLDFGQLSLAGGAKGSTFSMIESQHYQQQQPQRDPLGSVRVLPPLGEQRQWQRQSAEESKKH